MIVGVPSEVKLDEYRVALLPVGAEELTTAGHTVLVQAGAGQGSGIADAQYEAAGAAVVEDAETIWAKAELIVKVKEPQQSEWHGMRPGQVLFTYFHFAADEALTSAVMKSGATAIAYETIRDARGHLPLLTPMSEVAGRMSIQQGAKFLERPAEGRGILLAGVPGVAPAEVAILGGGVVGSNAAKVAAGLGASVRILDVNLDRLRYLDDIMPANVITLYSDRHTILESIERADLVIGAILIAGASAEAGPTRRPRSDETRRRDRRRLDRPRRLHRNQQTYNPQAPNLPGRRRRPLLRYQHAWRGRKNQHVCALQRHFAVHHAARYQGVAVAGAKFSGRGRRGERPQRTHHQPRSRGDFQHSLRPSPSRTLTFS